MNNKFLVISCFAGLVLSVEAKEVTVKVTFDHDAYRGSNSLDLTPSGYHRVSCNFKINEYCIQIQTKFYPVEKVFSNWEEDRRRGIEVNLDQDLGNFVIITGYEAHEYLISDGNENYEQINKNISSGEYDKSYLRDALCLPGDPTDWTFMRLDREISLKSDMNTVSTAREYLNCSFDEIIGWGLCTLLKHGLKAEIPIRHILDAIVSVIYHLTTKGPISEAEIRKQFYGHVSSVVQEYVHQKLNEATG